MSDALAVEITEFGPSPAVLDAVGARVLAHERVRALLGDARHRLLHVQAVDPVVERKLNREPEAPTAFRATIYDYTQNRALLVEGPLDQPDQVTVRESGDQPLPVQAEFDDAVEVLRRDPELGPALRERRLVPYRPMPPLVEAEATLPDGRVERTIAVGLAPVEKGGPRHEIVGVNLVQHRVLRFRHRFPNATLADEAFCGVPGAGQPTTSHGTAGQVWITVTQGGTVLWRFLALRPAASSGTRASGIELRFVDYRGRRVLYRGHVPILNVRYDRDACGPYRDWQYAESFFQANGQDVAPGFRLCPQPAKTVLDSGTDQGNFQGVAIYVQGQEVVLVSELEAGWYRYISEWRLHTDGAIRPRFMFGATNNSCVCNLHHHHAYWRFDFDIDTAGNNRVWEFNDPPIFPNTNWHVKHFEIKRMRDPGRKRKWLVENAQSGRGYLIEPGPNDGVATLSPDWPYPRGDVWVLRYHGNELDDGHNSTGSNTEADLDQFLNGEVVENQDVVLWYGAHFNHDAHNEGAPHVIGPDLRPFRR